MPLHQNILFNFFVQQQAQAEIKTDGVLAAGGCN
jgi:hypothetical protein